MMQRFIAGISRYSSVLKAGAICMAFAASSLNAQTQVHIFRKIIDSPNYSDFGYKVRYLPGNGYIIAGTTGSGGSTYNADMFLTRTNPDGTTVWSYTYGVVYQGNTSISDWAYSVTPTSDGGFVAVGEAQVPNIGTYAYIVKVDQNGALQWHDLVAPTGVNNAARYYDVIEDNGMYAVVGAYSTSSPSVQNDVLIAQYNVTGSLIRYVTVDASWGGAASSYDEGYSIDITNNGYAIVGNTHTNRHSGGATIQEVLLLEIDRNLSVVSNIDVFFQNFFPVRSMVGNNVISTIDGGLLVVGRASLPVTGNPSANNNDGFVMKFDSQRNYEWGKYIYEASNPGQGDEIFEAKELQALEQWTGNIISGGYVLGGYSADNGLVASDPCLLRLNANGSFNTSQTYNTNPLFTYDSYFRSLDIVTQGFSAYGDIGVAAVGSGSASSPIDWKVYFVKTNNFQLTTCDSKSGPEIRALEYAKDKPIGVKAIPTIKRIQGVEKRGFGNTETLCYNYIPLPNGGGILTPGKRGEEGSMVDAEYTGIAQILSNPVKSGEVVQLVLNVPTTEAGQMGVVITDMMGRVVLDRNHAVNAGKSTLALPLPKLAEGLYMVNVSWGGQATHLKLVITD